MMWQDEWGGQSDHMSSGEWWWMAFMMLFWVAVLVLLVWAVVRLSRAIESGRGPAAVSRQPEQRDTPRETLDRRYAAGEIDSAAYNEIRAGLERRGPESP
jgi:putative membrane protein